MTIRRKHPRGLRLVRARGVTRARFVAERPQQPGAVEGFTRLRLRAKVDVVKYVELNAEKIGLDWMPTSVSATGSRCRGLSQSIGVPFFEASFVRPCGLLVVPDVGLPGTCSQHGFIGARKNWA